MPYWSPTSNSPRTTKERRTHSTADARPQTLPNAQFRVFIELKSIEIRTEVQQLPAKKQGERGKGEGASVRHHPLEANWNHEPLDHTRSRGQGRLEYGCPFSRRAGEDSIVRYRVSSESPRAALAGEWHY